MLVVLRTAVSAISNTAVFMWRKLHHNLFVFICVYLCFCFILHTPPPSSCCIIVSTVGWTWWDWSLILGRIFLQCFDTVGWVIWPVKPVPDMTYNVFGATLNLALSIYLPQLWWLWLSYRVLNGLFFPFVCLFVCTKDDMYCSSSVSLSVCWQLYDKKTTERIFRKILPHVCVHEEELSKFWKSSASGCGCKNFLKDSSALRDGHFSTVRLISADRMVGISLKFYHRCILEQRCSWIQMIFSLSDVCGLWLPFFCVLMYDIYIK